MPELRDYQIDLIRRTQQSWRTGHKAPCIVLPCGGGKSVIVAEIAKRSTLNLKQVLFLVHRKELCEQIFRILKSRPNPAESLRLRKTFSNRCRKLAQSPECAEVSRMHSILSNLN